MAAYHSELIDRWTGFYAGVAGGAASSSMKPGLNYDHSQSFYDPGSFAVGPTYPYELASGKFPLGNGNSIGGFGSVSLGYNKVFSNNVLFGVEGDISLIRASTSKSVNTSGERDVAWVYIPSTTPFDEKFSTVLSGNVHTSTDWIGTLRARLGYVAGPMMLFASAGVALGSQSVQTSQQSVTVYTSIHSSYTSSENYTGAISRVSPGFAGSVGIEYSILPNVFLRTEAMYVQLRSISAPLSITNVTSKGTVSMQMSATLLRGGIAYRF